MKILLFLPDISRIGGVERVVANLANGLAADSRYELTILSCFNENPAPAFPLDPKVRLGSLNTLPYPENPVKKLLWYLRLRQPLNRYLQKDPHKIILAEGSYLCSVLGLLKLKGIIKIGCEHISFNAVSKAQKILRRLVYGRLDRLVVLTETDRAAFASFVPQVIHMPNFLPGIPSETADLGSSLIISAGRLAHQKGYDLLIEAFSLVSRKYPEHKLVIYGEGEDRQMLEQRIDIFGLQNQVFLPGSSSDIIAEFKKASVFVMSSRFEGFPMTLLEAMATGLPCISFDCSGPAEMISHQQDGILVKEKDVQALANAIVSLIKDPSKRTLLAKAARRKIEEHYTGSHIVRKWKQLFKELTAN